MPVYSEHPNYTARKTQWSRCRDLSEGGDSVKSKSEAYLPKLSGQNDNEYKAYKKRALFYDATDRTVTGLTGIIMRKEPVVEVPSRIDFKNDITGTGQALTEFIKLTVSELVTIGRYGVFIDRTESGSRPYLRGYVGESIINWEYDSGILSRVVLAENYYERDPDDRYKLNTQTQYRELAIENGVYVVYVHRKNEKGDYVVFETITPLKSGIRLDYIPFVFINPYGVDLTVVKPPILGVVDVNISHYQSSADLEHGRHFTALPTPWISGYKGSRQKNEAIKIGSETILTLDEGGQAGYMEFTGQGLVSVEKALEQKESMMAKLGARLLENPKKTAETADKAKIDATAEGSVLSSIAASTGAGIEKAFQYMAAWENVTGEISVKVNKDFLPYEMSPQLVTALMQSVQSGLLSAESFFDALQRGEIISEDKTYEDERERIDEMLLSGLGRTTEE